MDTLYIIFISLFVVALALVVSFVIKKYNINTKDYLDGIDVTSTVLSLIRSIARDMGVEQELVAKISHIVNLTLDYMRNLPEETPKEVKIADGFDLARELCLSFEIELNEDREHILRTLITVGFNVYETLEKNKNK